MAGRANQEESPLGDDRPLAKPLHLQRLEKAVQLDSFINFIHNYFSTAPNDAEDTSETEAESASETDQDGGMVNGTVHSQEEKRLEKMKLYNFNRVKKSRRWLKNVLLSDTSESEDNSPTEDDLQDWLRFHKLKQIAKSEVNADPELRQYQYYGVGLMSQNDPYPEHQKSVVGGKKKPKEKKASEKKKTKLKRVKIEKEYEDDTTNQNCSEMDASFEDSRITPESSVGEAPTPKPHGKKKTAAQQEAMMNMKRKRLWVGLSKKEIGRAQKQKTTAHKEMLTNAKRLVVACQREVRKSALMSQKVVKDMPGRARRLTREMLLYWKRYEKVEKEHRKRAEKEAQEQLRMDIELREAKRQQRKLNFLITQTELYAHFMSRKMSGGLKDERQEEILMQLDDTSLPKGFTGLVPLETEDDDYDKEEMKAQALKNAEDAFNAHQSRTQAFDMDLSKSVKAKKNDFNENFCITDPSFTTEDLCQPSIFIGKLKTYQLKGMNWLYSLYDKGINGILADEMGLGKTVQTIAFLATLAEIQGIWGPFLVIAPASTLHNWQQEFTKFVPKFKVVPYWGNTSDRKVLRKFWNQKDLHTEQASFHVLITSYQLVVQDVKYFQRIKWQYMVLDEAQAIKSTSSVRWKILLGFSCRNRLLLTGTPIQNTMAELWALLHFIMPTLFDSHDEFNEWFSKDIESHAENKSTIDEKHLSRLHMILKPFMLRRIKKDVENELSDKIEIQLYCSLTQRQKLLYQGLKNKISIEDLMQSSSSTSSQAQSATSSLMNLVMQFRKVCNHPDLFERREVKSPYQVKARPFVVSKFLFREGIFTSWNNKRLMWPNVFHPHHVHNSLFHSHPGKCIESPFSFSRFIGMSTAELARIMLCGLLERLLAVEKELKEAYRSHHRHTWSSHEASCKYLPSNALLLLHLRPLSSVSVAKSTVLQKAVFSSRCGRVYAFRTHRLHAMSETAEHWELRQRKVRHKLQASAPPLPRSPPNNQHVVPGSSPKKAPPASHPVNYTLPEFRHRPLPTQVIECIPTELPAFLTCAAPKIMAEPDEFICNDNTSFWWWKSVQACGSPDAQRWWLHGCTEATPQWLRQSSHLFIAVSAGGILSARPLGGWSYISIPDKESLVTDSGKLQVLDRLLQKLKSEGHRVLIYSQMTRMIDLLEEYMWHRKHTYMRLDGSSKISDRRDMVADFQARSDIFVFLLSTRAGGLGINLTAADTVIFYDSDWNPTVDQQAMDRAHRLGQTKQVTVYRLICKGTIEERILQRAREKSEIQRMVISGGNFKPDTLKPKEVVSLLLDDDELERKFRQRQDEKKVTEDGGKEKERKRRSDKGEKRGPKKKQRLEENNTTIPSVANPVPLPVTLTPPAGQDADSIVSVDSVPASPYSERSLSSIAVAQDDTSSEGPLVVDDGSPSVTPVPPLTSYSPGASPSGAGKAGRGGSSRGGTGRSRGRPRGSGRRGGAGGRGSLLAAAAAERAGAQAGTSAGFAAYGYSVPWSTSGSPGIRAPTSTSSGSSTLGPRSSALGSFQGGPGPSHQGHRYPFPASSPAAARNYQQQQNVPGSGQPPTTTGMPQQSTGMGFYVQGSSL